MLVCVGDLLEEVLVQLRADPVRGGDAMARSARVRGGCAANVAAIDAELGASPRFVGQVGDDNVGATLVDDLERRGVDVAVGRRGGTGVIVTMVGRGGRSRLIDRGAARRLSVIDPTVLRGATQLFVPAGALAEDPLATAVDQVLGEAAERRIPVTLGAPTVAELEGFGTAAFLELCATLRPQHVVFNRREHDALELGPRATVPGAGVTVVTNGRRPTLVMRDDDVRAVEVPPMAEVVDRTGVGDGFTAGFLFSRRSGADPVAAAHFGHRTAAQVLASLGPTIGPR